MKRTKKSDPWYNDRDKEIGGILLEGRGAAARYYGPWPDTRAGLRLMGVWPNSQTTIL